ncbi:sulfotransferase 1C4-like [Ruditapes philippinarum]|uniref:sulfotransferase 1C4-like n=1 Tax=Ruditapes philippinarum TaxID=129788 RepID=UPI00295B6E74|nr:sulfotransferase 1C4-like [Ruditapes philippinarum]XP_060551717.1 sulfotransferase 1C4-like [Ruditapes philippinarum]XP_060551718.1 sulfotransferase 1C4-like [Ruditapes philippinarum]
MTEVKVPDAGGATVTMMDIGGFAVPSFFKQAHEIKKIVDDVRNYTFRDEDLMLCTFGKTGTNWAFEILMMIQNKSASRIESNKLFTMLEANFAEVIDKQPSPRIINSHLPPRFLPLPGMKSKKIKTVLCLRNPKDQAVSYYCHLKGIKTNDYDGKWVDWLPEALKGKFEYGKYSEYLSEWQHLADDNPGFPLHIMYYEDLKKDEKAELDKLLAFLGVQIDDQLKQDIIEMCKFDKMKADKGKTYEAFTKSDFEFFRKGEVGDWKNWFSDAQNEMFDDTWKKETKDLTLFKFRYV